MNVVLVHGFLNRGSIMKTLAGRLEARGHRCFIPTLRPSDGREGLIALAGKLKEYVESSVPSGEKFALIGFSMGAVVARYYVQELSGCRRVVALFAVAGPHEGTLSAYFYPSRGVREMRPGSRFLAMLKSSLGVMGGIPITCYWTPFDLMIRPLRTTRLQGARHVRVPVVLHSLLLFSRRVSDDIAAQLKTAEPKQPTGPTPLAVTPHAAATVAPSSGPAFQ